ncbi:hypothetical protein DD742_03750 [Helicobacter pylori]|nr:hypothetical protein DD742_03750 [Helicobacter pylori]
MNPLFLGVCFFVFLNSFCFKFLCFEAPFLRENPFFLNSLFWGEPFVLNSLFFWGWFDEKSFLAFLTIWLVENLTLL